MSEKLPAYLKKHGLVLGLAAGVLIVIAFVGSALSVTDFDRLAEEYGDDAVAYLAATNFPRATDDQNVESYQFVGEGPNGVQVATFEVDWVGHAVRVTEPAIGDADVVAYLPERTYNEITARINAIRNGQVVSTSDGFALAVDLVKDTNVEIKDRGVWGEGVWKTRLLMWTSAIVIRGQDGLHIA